MTSVVYTRSDCPQCMPETDDNCSICDGEGYILKPVQKDFFDKPFDGSDYNDKRDRKRLTGQCKRVYKTMETGRWLTLDDIAAEAKAPQASVSAQIRHLRKPKFGSHIIDKRHNNNGLFEYRLRPREERQMDRLKCAICNRTLLTGEKTKRYQLQGTRDGYTMIVEATVGPECLDKAVPEVYKLLTKEITESVHDFSS